VYLEFDNAVKSSALYKFQHVGEYYIIACPNAAEPFEKAGSSTRPAKPETDTSGSKMSPPCFAQNMASLARELTALANQHGFNLQTGIHAGSAVGAIIGKLRAFYCIYGNTVNTASRLCNHAAYGQILVSRGFVDCLNSSLCSSKDLETATIRYEPAGMVRLKGFRHEVETFVLCDGAQVASGLDIAVSQHAASACTLKSARMSGAQTGKDKCDSDDKGDKRGAGSGAEPSSPILKHEMAVWWGEEGDLAHQVKAIVDSELANDHSHDHPDIPVPHRKLSDDSRRAGSSMSGTGAFRQRSGSKTFSQTSQLSSRESLHNCMVDELDNTPVDSRVGNLEPESVLDKLDPMLSMLNYQDLSPESRAILGSTSET
jgi:hypothetical protein